MTIRALSIAATGGRALMNKIDTIANNLANVNTTGYKNSRANFADLFYEQVQRAGAGTVGQNQIPTGTSFGTGVRLISTEKLFSQGVLDRTERPLDVAVDGDGFFRVTLTNGSTAFTRAGNFNLDAEGHLVTAEGYKLDPEITIPSNTAAVMIDTTGQVQVLDPQDPSNVQTAGQIKLSRFINPSGLESIGQNLYRITSAAGPEQEGNPGDQGFGLLRQGFLEDSNVDVIRELTELIQTQRAFEINGNSIQAADEILQSINNLRR